MRYRTLPGMSLDLSVVDFGCWATALVRSKTLVAKVRSAISVCAITQQKQLLQRAAWAPCARYKPPTPWFGANSRATCRCSKVKESVY